MSGGGAQVLTFAGPGNVAVTTSPISNGTGTLALNLTGGSLTLNTANTYSGVTTVANGRLQVNGSVAGSVVVGAGGKLVGPGAINGPVTVQAGGTLSPGGSLSILTLGNALTLAAGSTTFIEIQHSPLANDAAVVSGTLTEGGNLVVTNLGPAPLVAGDSFPLFSAAGYSGAFAAMVLPPLSGSLVWNTNTLNSSGTLSVVNLTPPSFANFKIAGSQLVINGFGGVNRWPFVLQAATNLGAPWTSVTTGQFNAAGGFILTNPLAPGSPRMFYRLQLQ
jgi:autotransporter-associated beta strand protein